MPTAVRSVGLLLLLAVNPKIYKENQQNLKLKRQFYKIVFILLDQKLYEPLKQNIKSVYKIFSFILRVGPISYNIEYYLLNS